MGITEVFMFGVSRQHTGVLTGTPIHVGETGAIGVLISSAVIALGRRPRTSPSEG